MHKLGFLMAVAIAFFAGAVSASVLADSKANERVSSSIDRAHEQQQAY
ncbi:MULTISPECIES: hypothetical protein [unclassified Polynucleobacter]|nr:MULTISPECIES: hypothetical protein [unclassified Polynucleobacter]MEA9602982.1 hypothetical protein [Polynucleobacter sp. JS-JIR-II-c23]QWE02515.1 hypothetical protein ICV90_10170 [Polynucleobacter sp. JS-JIR-II-b4]